MSKMGAIVCEWDTLHNEVYAARLNWEEFKKRRAKQRSDGVATWDFDDAWLIVAEMKKEKLEQNQ